ncbi:MAG: 16S rRNA (guanine(527)-N(7))-methyltransferase RsmG [Erysipelotrichaceae bacterium]|nr:16S rRNA (guanine(527)-N(7))-methyltransferase RsmG [Erysipelotrichaceae bacterium]
MELLELKKACEDHGLVITDKMLEQFDRYAQLLIEWNQKMNLTAIVEYDKIIEKHFYDSILCLLQEDIQGKVADVGSGAGFPSLPMKIVRPDLAIEIIEPLQKRCTFLNVVVDSLGLSDVKIINARAEDHAKDHRESYDVVCARAVANMAMLSELCIPLVKKGGMFVALKGSDGHNEYQKAQNALQKLGVELKSCYEDKLLDGSMRINFYFSKVKHTPMMYPRAFAKIKKQPL